MQKQNKISCIGQAMLLSAKLHFSKFINTVVIEEKTKKKKKKKEHSRNKKDCGF